MTRKSNNNKNEAFVKVPRRLYLANYSLEQLGAYVWLLLRADKQGKFCTSERTLARDLSWSRGKVRRFLENLQADQLLIQQEDQEGTTLLFVNSDTCDIVRSTNGPLSDPQVGPYNKIISNTPSVVLDINNKNIQDTESKLSRPFPEEPGSVLMTDKEWDLFQTKLGKDLAYHLIEKAEAYAKEQPKKWKKYSSHYLTLLNWHNRKLSDGYEFFEHPKYGWNYYKAEVVRSYNHA